MNPPRFCPRAKRDLMCLGHIAKADFSAPFASLRSVEMTVAGAQKCCLFERRERHPSRVEGGEPKPPSKPRATSRFLATKSVISNP
ncbi:hypothetical protein AciPR4_0082 [Terriglobus saanensis SP1PR4]|uniref:Uncharacterized protein n=1 Tax=Terriglobus saanensis (strain ATCC BAA-1853 / DSM 23119 / SP1PR4) TaxID=401053 RepID=E8UYX8_TERSS|nr:hypothetical protein AciPR4_0082 [Terriglobus saanensis SP1PR4]